MRRFSGFSLVETMVASTLVLVVFVGSYALVNYTLTNINYIQSSLTAAFLAQEGIELVIAQRDQNWLKGQAFNAGLSNGSYMADYTGVFNNVDSNPPLLFSDSYGYQYEEGSSSLFYRTIAVQEVVRDGMETIELKVVAEVSWTVRGQVFKTSTEAHLFDWFSIEQP
jgi:hypothetical protein